MRRASFGLLASDVRASGRGVAGGRDRDLVQELALRRAAFPVWIYRTAEIRRYCRIL